MDAKHVGFNQQETPQSCFRHEVCPCGKQPEKTFPCEYCGNQCCDKCTVAEGQPVCSSKCLQALADKTPDGTSEIVAELRRIGDGIVNITQLLGAQNLLQIERGAIDRGETDVAATARQHILDILEVKE